MNLRLPRSEMVELPVRTRIRLAIVAARICQISELRVFEEMNRTELAIAPFILIGSSNEDVLQ